MSLLLLFAGLFDKRKYELHAPRVKGANCGAELSPFLSYMQLPHPANSVPILWQYSPEEKLPISAYGNFLR